MIDHLTHRFNLKSMASIDTCQSRATCNVSSQSGTLGSLTEEPPKERAELLQPRNKRQEKGSERGDHSSGCFTSGSRDRSCKVFSR